VTTVSVPQHLQALERAQAVRLGRVARKREAFQQPAVIRGWLNDPPEDLLSAPLLDLIQWTRSRGRQRHPSIVQINAEAVRAGVNLMMPLGRASVRSRAWVAEHGLWYSRGAA
jgi:hypothetical protein